MAGMGNFYQKWGGRDPGMGAGGGGEVGFIIGGMGIFKSLFK